MPRTWIGVSGWSYDKWRGDYYPDDLRRGEELGFISRRFNSVEVNGTFYSLQRPDTFRAWAETTPDSFLFAVKGSRYLTHAKKLLDPETALANFFAQGVLLLGDKLGPLLWQLPDGFRLEPDRVERFLELLPRNTTEAARLARRHDDRIEGRSWTEPVGGGSLRHVLEVREARSLDAELVRVLRRHGVALVFSHSGSWTYVEELTAGFVYLRLHGAPHTYASRYGEEELDGWADRIARWRDGGEPDDAGRITDRVPPRRKGRDVYAYFDNDAHGHAPRDAVRLAERVGLRPAPVGAGSAEAS